MELRIVAVGHFIEAEVDEGFGDAVEGLEDVGGEAGDPAIDVIALGMMDHAVEADPLLAPMRVGDHVAIVAAMLDLASPLIGEIVFLKFVRLDGRAHMCWVRRRSCWPLKQEGWK